MWPFGNSYPYTNFHDMNMDWIIHIVKDVLESDSSVAEELKKKLNAPLAPGQAGDILTLLADGSTGWTDLGSAQQQAIIDAVDAWLAAHPEATTTVQDDSITLAKFTEALRNEFINLSTLPILNGVAVQSIINKSDIMSTYASGNYSLQGAEYNSTRDRYVFGFSTSDSTDPIIIETDNNFQFIRASSIQDGGHLNDITYVASEDKYYCATMETTAQIVVIDATNLTVLDIIQPSIVGTLTMLSYDASNNCFIGYSYISANNASLYKFSSDFSSSEELYANFYTDAVKNSFNDTITYLYSQGSTVVNGHFVALFWFGFEHDPAVSRLVVMNSTGTSIQYITEFANMNKSDEAETIINNGNSITIPSYYSDIINLYSLTINGNSSLKNPLIDSFPQYENTSSTPTLIDDISPLSSFGELYHACLKLTEKPAGLKGAEGVIFGERTGNNGYQIFNSPDDFAYRNCKNNNWSDWFDVLQKPIETTVNVLTLAEQPSVGGVKYYRFIGDDLSWIPFQNSSFKWVAFKVEYCFSQRVVTAYDYQNKMYIRNFYISGAWKGWEVEGIINDTNNVLNTALTIPFGHYTIVYTGSDTSWLPNADSGYKLGYFEITNFSDGNIMVKAVKENCSEVAYNHYTNNAWLGWKRYATITP